MTIIVAQRRGKETWIGADSRMCSGTFLFQQPVKKWVQVGDWWVGQTGSFRFDTLLKLQRPVLGGTPEQAAETLRQMVITDGWEPIHKDEPGVRRHDTQLLLIAPDCRVFEHGTSGVTIDANEEFSALGSGCDYALGAAYALKEENPDYRMLTAIRAATKYDIACGGTPFLLRLVF